MWRRPTCTAMLAGLLGCMAGAFGEQPAPPDVIAYDDGKLINMDLSENTLVAVRFTPTRPFNLTAVSVMFLNDRNTADGASVWVAESKAGVPAWPAISLGRIPPPLPDSTWVQYDLAGTIYFENDFFIIVRQKGSLFYPAYPSPSFWIGIDNGTTTHRTVKSYSDGQTWVTEGMGDALIRAGGSYGGTPCAVGSPYPASGATEVPTTTEFRWTPCPYAAGQDVYMGTDLNGVLTATRTSPFYQGNLSGSAAAYAPPVSLNPCTEYYWRVDTVPCPACPATKGPVQSFTTTCEKPLCLPGDINADGIVDLKDLGIMSGYWLEGSATPCVAGTVVAEIDDCAPTLEELTVPPAPQGYVYVGRTVVVNFRCTECTLPDDFVESPEDIVAIRSHTITKDGVMVCDVIVSHTFRKK
jgi:hypothetical protein